jgi:hypothetical protein
MRAATLDRYGPPESFLVSVARLARHLPLLGGLVGVPALSAAAVSFANQVTQAFLAPGDATAMISVELQEFAAAWIKLGVVLEQAAVFVGF